MSAQDAGSRLALRGHAAGNGGYGQGLTYRPPRLCPTLRSGRLGGKALFATQSNSQCPLAVGTVQLLETMGSADDEDQTWRI